MTDSPTRIEAVISDFGGVLTTPLVQSFMAFQDQTGISSETLGKAMQAATMANGDNPLYEMERGEITEVAFLELLTDHLEPLLGHRPEMHRFKEIYFEALQPNPPMIELMRELKAAGYRMAMLTNNVREWEPLWRSMLPVDEIFETVVDSGFVGCRKPESRIYAITLDRLGLPAESCLFVDDVLVNCEGARKAGMTAVHFKENEQAIDEIRSALSFENVA
jgi:putative hydrolase of the HAD superfamily